jgi:2-C-methyl-D-erythritol 4-phosphate cytidylyltransferase/2-C-methyl-D-erythritol 2,4-cyclodiphosphate synthase
LRALRSDPPDIVLIHDAARPFASPGLVERAIEAAIRHGAAVPGLPVTDTIKLVDEAGIVSATPKRAQLRAVQTPQAFRFALILDAHERAAAAGVDGLTDDGAVAEWAGHPLFVFPGDTDNVKLTSPTDFDAAERQVSLIAALGDLRTGTGFDVHAFEDGDHVWLNGIKVPHEKSLKGHSDADVGLHAITDAILGAIGEGDIGSHFPPGDERWQGAASEAFLRNAVELVARRGGAIANLDVTLLCEAPRIGPYREAMRQRIATIAGIAIERVGVKATTTEGLGFTGRREGIAAMALATIRLPWGSR